MKMDEIKKYFSTSINYRIVINIGERKVSRLDKQISFERRLKFVIETKEELNKEYSFVHPF